MSASDGWKTLGKKGSRRTRKSWRRDNAAARTPQPTERQKDEATIVESQKHATPEIVKKIEKSPVKKIEKSPPVAERRKPVTTTKPSNVVTPKAVVVSNATKLVSESTSKPPIVVSKRHEEAISAAKAAVVTSRTVKPAPLTVEMNKGNDENDGNRPSSVPSSTRSSISIHWTPRKGVKSPAGTWANPVSAAREKSLTPSLNPEAKPFAFPNESSTPKSKTVLNPTANEFHPPPNAGRNVLAPPPYAGYAHHPLLPYGMGGMHMGQESHNEDPVHLIIPYK